VTTRDGRQLDARDVVLRAGDETTVEFATR